MCGANCNHRFFIKKIQMFICPFNQMWGLSNIEQTWIAHTILVQFFHGSGPTFCFLKISLRVFFSLSANSPAKLGGLVGGPDLRSFLFRSGIPALFYWSQLFLHQRPIPRITKHFLILQSIYNLPQPCPCKGLTWGLHHDQQNTIHQIQDRIQLQISANTTCSYNFFKIQS